MRSKAMPVPAVLAAISALTSASIRASSAAMSASGSIPAIERSSKVKLQLSGVTLVATPPSIIVASMVACGTVKSWSNGPSVS